jgi:hypothetical protein
MPRDNRSARLHAWPHFRRRCRIGSGDGLERRIQNRFGDSCCWRESVVVHDSPVSIERRSEMDRQNANGKTELR